MKKWITKLTAAVLTVGLLASCGGGTTNTTAKPVDGTTAQSGTSDVKLTVSIWDENQRAGLQQIVDDFTAKTGIDADIQVVTWENYWTTLSAGASGGELPDVFWMHSNEAQKYMQNAMLLDLTDRIAASDVVDMTKYPEDISVLYNEGGKQFAIPKDIDTIAIWYNKALFDKAGVAYPDDTWEWTDFYENAKKLHDPDNGVYGVALAPDNNQAGYYNTIYSYGGYVINDDKTKSGYDDPKTVEAMELYAKIVTECNPPIEVLTENKEDGLFTAGKAAMILQGSWMLAAYLGNDYTLENADIAPLPKVGDKRVSIYNGLGWVAAANTEYPEEAWKLIEYFGSKEAQEKQAQLGVTMSAYEGTSEAWAKSTDVFNLDAYLQMMDDMVIRPYSRNTIVWENRSHEYMKEVWMGDKDMKTALTELAAEMNTMLADE